jgi:hypothetical protein
MPELSSLDKTLSTCFKFESEKIQRQKDKLKEVYDTLPDLIKSTSQMMGIDTESLVSLAYRVTCTKENFNMHDVIHVLYLFYAIKARDECEKSEEKQ